MTVTTSDISLLALAADLTIGGFPTLTLSCSPLQGVGARIIPTSVDADSRWDSQGAAFLIRCSDQEESRDGSSDWGTNGLHIGGFASFSAAMC
jgi:hypothetical protein